MMEQVTAEAIGLLVENDAFSLKSDELPSVLTSVVDGRHELPVVLAILEPRRERLARELATASANLAAQLGGETVGITVESAEVWPVGSWGIDRLVCLIGARVEEDVAQAVTQWVIEHRPRAILIPGTLWGREVGARVAASLGLGLVGDAIDVSAACGRIVASKPAFGGRLLAEITVDTDPQMVTLRPGATRSSLPRDSRTKSTTLRVSARDRVKVIERSYDEDADTLFSARAVVGVGMGVAQDEYPILAPFLRLLHAPLACTRKVADGGWLPRTRQVGLTGHHIAPKLYVAIGLRGGFNHTVGVRRAGVVLAINSDHDAPIFGDADVGIVGDWREVVPHLVRQLTSRNISPVTKEKGAIWRDKSFCMSA